MKLLLSKVVQTVKSTRSILGIARCSSLASKQEVSQDI